MAARVAPAADSGVDSVVLVAQADRRAGEAVGSEDAAGRTENRSQPPMKNARAYGLSLKK